MHKFLIGTYYRAFNGELGMKFGAILHVKFMGSAQQWRLEHAPRIEMNIILVRGGWGGAQRVCLTGKPGAKGLKIKSENKKNA